MSVLLRSSEFTPLVREFGGALTVDRATAALPQTASSAIFTITGGRVLILDLVGEVTTVIQTQACNTKILYDPSGAGADTDLCAVLDISADAVGSMYSLTGTAADAMTVGLWSLTSAQLLARPLILSAGAIELSTAASNTGSVKWTCLWRPMTTGATVTAA